MTLHAKIIGTTFALALGLGSMMAPAMAATTQRTDTSYQCSIGETFNGGSIVGEDDNTSQNLTDPCRNIGRY